MSELNIYTHDLFIKRLEYNLEQLAKTLEQMDIFIYSAKQLSQELKKSCHDEVNYQYII
ncbi:MAG TPA: hypothetical protein VMW10_06790 [Alphaproteobacteria bacterium]|nr:hypothetical protein [Alphaproteobacteria bacterium]